jgi:hypothetical protein
MHDIRGVFDLSAVARQRIGAVRQRFVVEPREHWQQPEWVRGLFVL